MSLLIVVLILIVWAIYGVIQKATPSDPPIDDIEAHVKKLMQADSQAERRRIIKEDANLMKEMNTFGKLLFLVKVVIFIYN